MANDGGSSDNIGDLGLIDIFKRRLLSNGNVTDTVKTRLQSGQGLLGSGILRSALQGQPQQMQAPQTQGTGAVPTVSSALAFRLRNAASRLELNSSQPIGFPPQQPQPAPAPAVVPVATEQEQDSKRVYGLPRNSSDAALDHAFGNHL